MFELSKKKLNSDIDLSIVRRQKIEIEKVIHTPDNGLRQQRATENYDKY